MGTNLAGSGNVKRNPLSAQVAEELERMVLGGGLELGSSLPSEAELAARFGVSRVVIREATRALETRGLIEVSQGKRPVIVGLSAAMPGHFFSSAVRYDGNALLELIEVRRALEVHIARLAAIHASEEDLRAMRRTIEVMSAKSVAGEDDPSGFDDADAEFHQRLAAASGNRLMHLLVEALKDPLRASRNASRQGRFARGLGDTGTVAAHQKILAKVAARDPEGAARAMEMHLSEATKDLHAAPVGEEAPGERARGGTGATGG